MFMVKGPAPRGERVWVALGASVMDTSAATEKIGSVVVVSVDVVTEDVRARTASKGWIVKTMVVTEQRGITDKWFPV